MLLEIIVFFDFEKIIKIYCYEKIEKVIEGNFLFYCVCFFDIDGN